MLSETGDANQTKISIRSDIPCILRGIYLTISWLPLFCEVFFLCQECLTLSFVVWHMAFFWYLVSKTFKYTFQSMHNTEPIFVRFEVLLCFCAPDFYSSAIRKLNKGIVSSHSTLWLTYNFIKTSTQFRKNPHCFRNIAVSHNIPRIIA